MDEKIIILTEKQLSKIDCNDVQITKEKGMPLYTVINIKDWETNQMLVTKNWVLYDKRVFDIILKKYEILYFYINNLLSYGIGSPINGLGEHVYLSYI